MKRFAMALALCALLVAPLTIAGEGHGCEAGTQECLDYMVEKYRSKGSIGIEGEWKEDGSGIVVSSFIDGMNAREAGIRVGDVLVAINGIAMNDKEALMADSANRMPGSTAKVTVVRNGEKQSMKVQLTGMSDEQIAKYVGMHMMDHVKVAKADDHHGHKH